MTVDSGVQSCGAASRRRWRVWWGRGARWLGWVALALSLLFGGYNLLSRFDPEFRSPFDEHTHFDYWWRIYAQQTVPGVYDRMQHGSLRIWGCYGDRVDGGYCQSSGQGASEHENTASNYLPTFYAATAAMAWVLDQVVETHNLFHLAKLANLAWGLIALVLIAWLARALQVPWLLCAVLVFAVAQTPAFVFAAITLNQEMFVLLFCLAGLIGYVRRTADAGRWRFALESGLVAGICLTIKPTALLLPVMLVMAELLASPRPWRERLWRVGTFSAVVVLVYLLCTVGINQWRGVHPSDGKMRDYLLGFGDTRGWRGWVPAIWTAFTRSTASLHWRTLVDWNLPWLFLRFHPFILTMLAVVIPYLLVVEFRRWRASLAARLFFGAAAAFVVLPVALAVYLMFSDFPYFFQPRYYTAYVVVGVVMAMAFLSSLVREGLAAARRRWPGRFSSGASDAA